jgi:phosphatidylglycerophosphate synthase
MSHDTIIHRFIRPAVRVAADTGLTPNQITVARLVTGLAAAFMFSMGSYDWMGWGGIVFVFSMLLDRADGELARQTGQMSSAGHCYDITADGFASIATFVGLGVGVSHTSGTIHFWLGALAGLGTGALFIEANVLKLISVNGHNLFGSRFTVDPDDAMIFVPILVWCNLAAPVVFIAAVITPLAAIGIGMRGLHSRRVANIKSVGLGHQIVPK